ncbi:MAG: aminoglycoside phosphotransferase family protein [Proteobacteria bacterium]|nr:aminoglycoside phosphotransferase family protein [Pseudomonadota bacterium]
MDKIEITARLVKQLIKEQFPLYAHFSVVPVPLNGHDNRTFRLGERMLVRLPSSEEYVKQVEKEHKWLPLIAPYLPLSVPKPIAMGNPSKDYPWNWSIYKWLEGNSANTLEINEETLQNIAVDLACFLNKFHKFAPSDAPSPGLHNWWRAAHTSVYDEETRSLIIKLSSLIDAKKARFLWEKSIKSMWYKDPVWVHGDIASGNILIKENKLSAVIDFGCMGIGDPACDLTIAWTFFKDKSREKFRSMIDLDSKTWERARGWGLWKALYELSILKDKGRSDAMKQQQVIKDILEEGL